MQKEKGSLPQPTGNAASAVGSPQAGCQQPGIFLAWGGEIYGPATEEEVEQGVRTGWFEKGTTYWREGFEAWRSIDEFAGTGTNRRADVVNWAGRRIVSAPHFSKMPEQSRKLNRGKRRRTHSAKPRALILDRRGRAIVFGFAALAVALTVGILLLLMLI